MDETQDDNETTCNEYIIQEITVIGDKPIIGHGVSETASERLLVIDKGESLSKFIERVTKPLSDLKTEFELQAVKSDESIKSDDESKKRPTDGKIPSDETSLDDWLKATSKFDEDKVKSDDVSGAKPDTKKALRDGSKEEITSVHDLVTKVDVEEIKSDVEPSAIMDEPSTQEPTPTVEQLPIDVTDESLADPLSGISRKPTPTPTEQQPPIVTTTKPVESVPSKEEQMVLGAMAPPETTSTADLTSDLTTPATIVDKEKQKEDDAAKIDTTKPEIDGDSKTDEPIRDLAAVASAVKAKIDDIQSTLGTAASRQDDKEQSESSKGTEDDSTSKQHAGKSIVTGFSSDITTPADDDTDNEDEDIEALVYSIMSKVDKLFAKDF